jgi:hypothetical protein
MREPRGDQGGGDPRDRDSRVLRPEEVGSFVSLMKKHGFLIDYLGENRFKIGSGPHERSLLIIQVEASGVSIVDITEEFIKHYYATPRKATLKQLIIEALRGSGLFPDNSAADTR